MADARLSGASRTVASRAMTSPASVAAASGVADTMLEEAEEEERMLLLSSLLSSAMARRGVVSTQSAPKSGDAAFCGNVATVKAGCGGSGALIAPLPDNDRAAGALVSPLKGDMRSGRAMGISGPPAPFFFRCCGGGCAGVLAGCEFRQGMAWWRRGCKPSWASPWRRLWIGDTIGRPL